MQVLALIAVSYYIPTSLLQQLAAATKTACSLELLQVILEVFPDQILQTISGGCIPLQCALHRANVSPSQGVKAAILQQMTTQVDMKPDSQESGHNSSNETDYNMPSSRLMVAFAKIQEDPTLWEELQQLVRSPLDPSSWNILSAAATLPTCTDGILDSYVPRKA
jgi:hypothetical protein